MMKPAIHPPRSPWVVGLAGLLVAASIVTTASCVTRAGRIATEPGTDTSPKLTRFTYFEEGRLAFVGVDVRAAEIMKPGSRDLLPIGIGLANNSTDDLRFDRESFVLETEDGARYPLVPHAEYLARVGDSRSDIRLADALFEAMQTRFVNYSYNEWRLYPVQGELSPAQESVTLGRRFWTAGYLYFPIPEGGAKGKTYNLLVENPQIPETLIVTFRID